MNPDEMVELLESLIESEGIQLVLDALNKVCWIQERSNVGDAAEYWSGIGEHIHCAWLQAKEGVWDRQAAIWSEYDSAAEWCARRGIVGDFGDPLPPLLSDAVARLIDGDPESFMDRVKDTAYMLAMEAK